MSTRDKPDEYGVAMRVSRLADQVINGSTSPITMTDYFYLIEVFCSGCGNCAESPPVNPGIGRSDNS